MHGGTDRDGAQAGGGGDCGGRHLPEAGDSRTTFYRWKRKYAGLGISEIRRLVQAAPQS